jgi:lysophospholipase L1-like esterase
VSDEHSERSVNAIRLVCIGDSFTEGMCDDTRADGEFLGWADRLAQHLAQQPDTQSDTQVQYANLAIRGKLLDQVVDDQIDAALALNPTIITFHAGPNDVLRRGTDLDDLFRRYDQAVQRLTTVHDGEQHRVVLFTAIGRAGGTGKVAQLLADRFALFNANVRTTAKKYDCIVVDLEPIDVLTDRRLWFEDRLHLNTQGHERVAAAAFAAITNEPNQEQWWTLPLPPAPKRSKTQDLKADALWVKNHMLPWLHRRIKGVSSGDGRMPKDQTLRTIQ